MSSALSLPSVCETPSKKIAVDGEEEVVVRKPLSLLVSAKQQKAIWDDATHADICAPHNHKCTALKYLQTSRLLTKFAVLKPK